MRRNLVASLFEHETISTTVEKAKEVKAFAEKLITLAKKGTLSARRRAIALLGNHDIIDHEDNKAVRKGTVIGKLFSEIGPRYLDRPGGYTRIIRLSLRRLGDNGQLVLLQLVGPEESSKKETKAAAKKRSRRRAKKTIEADEAEATEVEETVETEEVVETEESSETGKISEDKDSTKNAGEDIVESDKQAEQDEK
jgi:large subunit ribosomal protein L17